MDCFEYPVFNFSAMPVLFSSRTPALPLFYCIINIKFVKDLIRCFDVLLS
ncbi:hypothetical protein CLOSTHATH_06202 [Hungatella hathewayi DSM 13479]|uniref:Uncharacterized protein n=1 Tax=Hungatella hathewayi DSM 13479 TaxID=566550 RepID=D3ARE6_9FIRM|nr:hypothetical protein CLOSTHATH_06202 [Hungatella hathewayi DSM 13479]